MDCPEQALWRAVILQALLDAKSESSKPELQYHKRIAHSWLTSGSGDFHEVASLAGFESNGLRIRINAALKRNCQWRKPNRKRMSRV